MSQPLLGRERECVAIDEFAASVRDGLSGSLVLIGEAGIGKTRLLRYATEAMTDFQVASVSGLEPEDQLAFAALHRLLLPYLYRVDRLPGPQRDALRAAFGLVTGRPADRFLVGLAVLTLLAEVAGEQPLVCLVDDAHWIDRESLEALAFVAHRLHAEGVGLLLTVRDGQSRDGAAGDPGSALLRGLPVMPVGGLSDEPARQLLAASASGRLDDRVVARIVSEAGGNPLALVELSGYLSGDQVVTGSFASQPLPIGPQMEAHFLRQVRAMPAPTQLFLLVASVAPAKDPAALWRAAALLDLPATAADPAVAAGILSLTANLAFRHPLIRSAVYGGATTPQRREVHRTLAMVIDREGDPDRRAWHLAEATAGLDEDVAGELEQASERARHRGGYTAQAVFLARSAALTPDPQRRAGRHLAAAQARVMSGDPNVAQTMIEQATPGLTSAAMRGEAELLRGSIEVFFARLAGVTPILLNAIETIDGLDQPLTRRILFEALQASVLAHPGPGVVEPAVVARFALRTVRPAAPDVWDLLLDAFATRLADGYGPAVPLMRAAVSALLTEESLVETGMPLAVFGSFAADDLWDDRGRRAVLDRLITFNRDQGAIAALRVTLQSLAIVHVWAGEFAEAEACYIESSEITRAIGLPDDTPLRLGLFAWQGRADQVRACADEVHKVWAGQLAIGSLAMQAFLHLALLENSLGNYPEALAYALEVYHVDPPGEGNHALAEIVEAGVRAGDHDAADAALRRLATRAELVRTGWALGLLARCRALLAAPGDAEALYRESIDELGRTLVVTELARSHLLYGEWLRRQKRRADARVELRTAYDMFTAMGAALFAERARTELLATGERARKRTAGLGTVPPGRDLTPQEAQVAGLAAAGATNSEIATRLFVTTSTVEYHLNKIFRKLDITSRRQLARVLRDQPPASDEPGGPAGSQRLDAFSPD